METRIKQPPSPRASWKDAAASFAGSAVGAAVAAAMLSGYIYLTVMTFIWCTQWFGKLGGIVVFAFVFPYDFLAPIAYWWKTGVYPAWPFRVMVAMVLVPTLVSGLGWLAAWIQERRRASAPSTRN